MIRSADRALTGGRYRLISGAVHRVFRSLSSLARSSITASSAGWWWIALTNGHCTDWAWCWLCGVRAELMGEWTAGGDTEAGGPWMGDDPGPM